MNPNNSSRPINCLAFIEDPIVYQANLAAELEYQAQNSSSMTQQPRGSASTRRDNRGIENAESSSLSRSQFHGQMRLANHDDNEDKNGARQGDAVEKDGRGNIEDRDKEDSSHDDDDDEGDGPEDAVFGDLTFRDIFELGYIGEYMPEDHIEGEPIDCRKIMPRNWDQVEALQFAIRPTIDDFVHLTRQKPKFPYHYLSYDDQVEFFQEQLNAITIPKIGRTIPLLRLEAWSGGLSVNEIAPLIRARVPEVEAYGNPLAQPEPQSEPQNKGKLHVLQANEAPNIIKEVEKVLKEANARLSEGSSEAPDMNIDLDSRLNAILAHRHNEYKSWLTSKGLAFFKNRYDRAEGSEKKEYFDTWDYWCTYEAPFVFEEVEGRDETSRRRVRVTPGPAPEMIQRPTITYEEARRGFKSWSESEAKDSIPPESAQHLHAFKKNGKDVMMGAPPFKLTSMSEAGRRKKTLAELMEEDDLRAQGHYPGYHQADIPKPWMEGFDEWAGADWLKADDLLPEGEGDGSSKSLAKNYLVKQITKRLDSAKLGPEQSEPPDNWPFL